jgi:hypothetical protein
VQPEVDMQVNQSNQPAPAMRKLRAAGGVSRAYLSLGRQMMRGRWGHSSAYRRIESVISERSRLTPFFILGTGKSVNSLPPSHLSEIKAAVSVGLNSWSVHELVPTFYTWEHDSLASVHTKHTALAMSRFATRCQDMDGENPKLILRLRHDGCYLDGRYSAADFGWPEELRRNLIISDDLHISLPNTDVLRLFYRTYLRTCPWRITHGSAPLAHRASVIWAVLLAIRLGFRAIVLIGMDMNDSRHFYQIEGSPWYDEEASAACPPHAGVHRTADPLLRPDTVPLILNHLRVAVEKHEIFLYQGSPGHGSPLDDLLPNYVWRQS